MVFPSRAGTAAGLPAFTTGPWAWRLAEAPVSVTRAVIPTRITAIAATSDTATIFRWVVRSAVTSEWFMGSLPRSCPLVVPTGRSVQRRNADSRFKFQLTVAFASSAVPAEAGNTVYLLDEYGFVAARLHHAPGSQRRGEAVTFNRAGVTERGIWEPYPDGKAGNGA